MLTKVWPRSSPKASGNPRLPWPPSEKGERVPVARSSVTTYYIGIGLSHWSPYDHESWIWFRPERWRTGRAFPELCGELQQIKVFRGLTPDVRKAAHQFFDWIVSYLLNLAAKEAEAAR